MLPASGRNNSQHCWPTILGVVVSVCSSLKFDWFQTLCNNMQQGVQMDTTCNIQQCWELLANKVASVCTGLKSYRNQQSIKTKSARELCLVKILTCIMWFMSDSPWS